MQSKPILAQTGTAGPFFFEFTRLIGDSASMPKRGRGWSVARWSQVCSIARVDLSQAAVRERLVADNPHLFLRVVSDHQGEAK